MKVLSIPFTDIIIPVDRQRVEYDEQKLLDLAGSITTDGLLHPIVVRTFQRETILVAGWRRLKAMEHIWFMGDSISCGTQIFPPDHAPCIQMGELDSITAFRIELEENLRRENLSWQDEVAASSRLATLIQLQAAADAVPEPTLKELAAEIYKSDSVSSDLGSQLRQDIILADHLADPDVAKAPSRKEAMKILVRKEETRKNAELGQRIGATFSAKDHRLLKGDCLDIMATLDPGSFDCILSDPPYGIDAQDFNDSGGKAGSGSSGGHFYDDSHSTWIKLMSGLVRAIDELSKPQAHLYLFCDPDRFHALRDFVGASGVWKCFRTPLIWFNPGGMRAPWPEQGPQRKYQVILYAVKGKRPVTRLYGDVLSYPSDTNLGHPAQKPVALLADLLRRSVRPGETVLDPFAGSGSIFAAAHELKVKATGIELDEAAFGIASKRLGELK